LPPRVTTEPAATGVTSPSLDALVAVVLHRSRVHESRLAEVLGRGSALPVRNARYSEWPVPGTIYLAPRDRHLLLDKGRLSLSGGPRARSVLELSASC